MAAETSAAASLADYVAETSCMENSVFLGLIVGSLASVGKMSLAGSARRSLRTGIIAGSLTAVVTYSGCMYYKSQQNVAIAKFYEQHKKDQEEKILRMYGKKNVVRYEQLFIDARRKEEEESSKAVEN